jgi:hypothetical protein
MVAVSTSITYVNFYTLHNIPEDSHVHKKFNLTKKRALLHDIFEDTTELQ